MQKHLEYVIRIVVGKREARRLAELERRVNSLPYRALAGYNFNKNQRYKREHILRNMARYFSNNTADMWDFDWLSVTTEELIAWRESQSMAQREFSFRLYRLLLKRAKKEGKISLDRFLWLYRTSWIVPKPLSQETLDDLFVFLVNFGDFRIPTFVALHKRPWPLIFSPLELRIEHVNLPYVCWRGENLLLEPQSLPWIELWLRIRGNQPGPLFLSARGIPLSLRYAQRVLSYVIATGSPAVNFTQLWQNFLENPTLSVPPPPKKASK